MNFSSAVAKSCAVLTLALSCSGFARASSVLYSNAPDLSSNQNGDCEYNSACGAYFLGTPNVYAAQAFTLSSASIISAAGFNSEVQGFDYGTAVNYLILGDSMTGTPGTELESGTAVLTNSPGPTGAAVPTTNYSFSLTPLSLYAGTYFLAINEVTTNLNDFLSLGVASSGALESTDNGQTFSAGYGGDASFSLPSVAISISGDPATTAVTPEPSSFALLGTGLLGVAGVLRKRLA